MSSKRPASEMVDYIIDEGTSRLFVQILEILILLTWLLLMRLKYRPSS